MIERVRDGVEIVRQVAVVGGADVHINRLELDENDGQAVDETNQIRAPVVMGRAQALNFQFADSHETILLGLPEIDNLDANFLLLALVVAIGHRHPIADHLVKRPVVLGA